MSTLIRAFFAISLLFGVNLAVAQNAEWVEGKFPGHDREHSESNQGQPAAPGGSPQSDKGQPTDDQSQKDREQADQKSSAARKQAAPEYPKNN